MGLLSPVAPIAKPTLEALLLFFLFPPDFGGSVLLQRGEGGRELKCVRVLGPGPAACTCTR